VIIQKLKVQNYKSIHSTAIELNPGTNIFVGENDSGKSTILEAISIVTSGKLNGYAFDRQIKANLFNSIVRKKYIEALTKFPAVLEPPMMVFEAYCLPDGDAIYTGKNNDDGTDCPGIRVVVSFNPEYENAYKQMLAKNEIYDIPVEFYKVDCKYFNGSSVVFRYSPFKMVFIDTTRKDYSYMVDKFVAENITTYLSSQEQLDLTTAYRKSKNDFHTNETVKKLNESVRSNVHIANHAISIDLKEEDMDEWKKQMAIVVDDTPFENMGFGSQNVIKMELAIKNSAELVNMILIEEPENNLSYTNMTKLIKKVQQNTGKQIFISTHSSYVANKLGLDNLILVYQGKTAQLKALNKEAKRYFQKLPGYDTLRLVLAAKVILVEGPADNLVLERAYHDAKEKLPIEDGIDIIVVDSLAFKRYCDIAIMMKKKIKVVTDNDGNIEENINQKYKDYVTSDYIEFFYEADETLNTLEPSVLAANCILGEPTENFRKVISASGSMKNKTKQEVLSFMLNNKTEWTMRIFEDAEKIEYPEYIKNAIK